MTRGVDTLRVRKRNDGTRDIENYQGIVKDTEGITTELVMKMPKLTEWDLEKEELRGLHHE